jgi:endogenous inhibitor of DNA gyrase (YacG/DUF329 family)
VDLAKWLGEEYRIPGPRPGDGVAGADPRDRSSSGETPGAPEEDNE